MISWKRKDKYKQLPPEDKKKLQENDIQWLNSLSPKRQLELRQKVQKYHKNRYGNMMVKVKYTSMYREIPFYVKIMFDLVLFW